MTPPKPASAPQADAWKLVQARCSELVVKHGGQRKAAKAVGIDEGYFCHLLHGTKRHASDEVLAQLGITRIVQFALAASAQVRDKYCRCEDCHEPDATLCTTCAEMRHTKPAAEPVPVAQGDGSVLAFVRVMRNLRERYPADADVVEAYSNILQAAIIKQAEARTALEASLAACRANEARYLWLRNKAELVDDSDYWLPQVCSWDYKPGPQLNERFPSLDSAIDSLRQEATHAE